MSVFIVNANAQPDGIHEVHNLDNDCTHLPLEKNRKKLGNHPDCSKAILAAGAIYEKVDGCKYCAPECNNNVQVQLK